MYESSEQLRRKGFDQVYVEIDRYDGPAAGLADVHGVPHYFQRDTADDERFFVWPTDDATLALEQEQWLIYVAWNARHEAGAATTDTHPGHGGIDIRYDELRARLEPLRAVPADARELLAEWSFASDLEERYQPNGPDYLVRWREPA